MDEGRLLEAFFEAPQRSLLEAVGAGYSFPDRMPELSSSEVCSRLDTIYRAEAGRIRATLIRMLGDFDRAEDAMHDAFNAALQRWPADGFPANPRAWLISTGRFKAIDAIRRRTLLDSSHEPIATALHGAESDGEEVDEELPDDRLRLIFTCCHPVFAEDVRTALTLREVCGLTTEEIARAFLTPAPAIAQRIVRAKAKIRAERIPYRVPSGAEVPGRLEAVLAVVYLLFNEGYSATSGNSLIREELSAEAIRLGRILLELIPAPEMIGLLALMLLHESRRTARVSTDGEIVLLGEQDRSAWSQPHIEEALPLVRRALETRRFGPYTLQAAIAAVHAEAPTPEATDWRQIRALYTALLAIQPSPVVELNRAVAVAMHEGPAAGLSLIDALIDRGDLRDYHLAHSARADLCRRLGRRKDARTSYEQALALAGSGPEKRFLERRLKEVG